MLIVVNYLRGDIMRITAVTKQKNGSYDIYVDGEKYQRLDSVVLASYRKIKVGEEITKEELDDILSRSGVNFAFDSAIKQISRSLKSESEIRKKLEEKGYTESQAQGAIDKLKSYGYINDLAYAHAYINTYGKDRGKLRLIYELGAKGIDKDIIDQVLPDDEEENARNLAVKKVKKYVEKEKMIRYLMSRGFEYELARRVSGEVLEEGNYD